MKKMKKIGQILKNTLATWIIIGVIVILILVIICWLGSSYFFGVPSNFF